MKKVYLSLLLHGNMCYDRYTKQEIRAKFPTIYAAGIRGLAKFPQVTAHIDLPGLTVLSLRHHAPWLLDEMQPLIDRGQIVMVGCQYAASHALCADEESDLLSGRVTREITERECATRVTTFFPQEMTYHPQQPLIMEQMGHSRLIVMPPGWKGPRRILGVDGRQLSTYPLNLRTCRLGALEQYYDAHDDGSFVMAGGDFELLCNLEGVVRSIEELAARGKVIEWTTVDRFDAEVGLPEPSPAPNPCGQCLEDVFESPSFSRWVGDPEDMIWHGHAVEALEAVRAAGFANVVAATRGMNELDVPLAESYAALPDNVWDHHFEEVTEYPETEALSLSRTGGPTLMSRAWHLALIGLNSDASGWFPWTPRTRHRNLCLRSARLLAQEVTERFADDLAQRLAQPGSAARSHVLALNPGPARTVTIEVSTPRPMALVGCATATLRGEHGWTARAEVALPAYGYRLLELNPSDPTPPPVWTAGGAIEADGVSAALVDGRLTIDGLTVAIEPFRLSDPSGTAPTEDVKPDWACATTRVRSTLFGPELEVFCELAWAVWLRLTIGLRAGRAELCAEVHFDMPRRIGNLGYDPEGLKLSFRGAPGRVLYDIPYATITHTTGDRSWVAVQRFAALDSAEPFGVICLGGNQSFQVCGDEGYLAANLGTSTQGRPDTRPQCILHADGTGDHLITSKGDQFANWYEHRFALVRGGAAHLALVARQLRTAVPVHAVTPGGGELPAEGSLLTVGPESTHVTAFRRTAQGCSLAINDISGQPHDGLVAYGFAEVTV
ncbi:MAG: hypothetical protein HZB16_13850 [Armatimonadetes bacterium]|nr:hypothetical protein [Armatimonadota bacterium]